MSALSTTLLYVLAAVNADETYRYYASPEPQTADYSTADYRTAFDEPTDERTSQQSTEREFGAQQRSPARRAPRLPLELNSTPRAQRDNQVMPAAAEQAPTRLTSAEVQGAIPLPPPTSGGDAPTRRLPTASIATVVGSLAGVVGLFLIMAWLMRRGMPRSSGLLPREVVEVLGRAPLVGRQQMHLLRLGNKLVLVSICAGVVETLAEVTDPLEVDRLTGLCYQTHPHGASASFRQVFQSFEGPRAGYPAGRAADRLDLSQLDALALGKEAGHVR